MTRAAAIIAAMLDGKPGLVFERTTGMVHGWGLWMRALPERLGLITAEAPSAMVDVWLRRPAPPSVRASPALGRWQAARSLFYQDWDPPLREERGLRWLAGTTSILMHLLFVLLMLYIAMVRLPPPPAAESDGTRVQIEFIGEDSPDEEGGGASELEAGASSPVATVAEQPAASEPAAVASALPQQQESQPVSPAAQQILQVTETETPTTEFVLPPATARTPDFIPPQITVPALGIPTREIRIVEIPPAQRPVPREFQVPVIAQPQLSVREREMTAPLPAVRSVEVPAPTVRARAIDAPVPSIRQAEIASPAPAPSPVAATGARAEIQGAGRAPATAATDIQGAQGASGGGAGAAAPRPGGAPSVRRGDDWGASARSVPGEASAGARDASGLFNADGSARLPSDGLAGKAPQAGPPGSRQAQQADADRAGKWLERPDYPYDPTMFDKFWVPNESLLAEWVRRSVKEVEIPIPGTSKKVKCVVSVLALGGACAVSDPNLNEQPASARPPPDIPVKRNPIPVDS